MFKKMKEIGKIKRRGKTKGQVGHGHFVFLFNFSHFLEVLEMHEMSIFQLAKLSALSMWWIFATTYAKNFICLETNI